MLRRFLTDPRTTDPEKVTALVAALFGEQEHQQLSLLRSCHERSIKRHVAALKECGWWRKLGALGQECQAELPQEEPASTDPVSDAVERALKLVVSRRERQAKEGLYPPPEEWGSWTEAIKKKLRADPGRVADILTSAHRNKELLAGDDSAINVMSRQQQERRKQQNEALNEKARLESEGGGADPLLVHPLARKWRERVSQAADTIPEMEEK